MESKPSLTESNAAMKRALEGLAVGIIALLVIILLLLFSLFICTRR